MSLHADAVHRRAINGRDRDRRGQDSEARLAHVANVGEAFGRLVELGELLLSRTLDGVVRIKGKFDTEAASVIDQAIRQVAAELPRAAGTTHEQHLLDAFVELLRRHEVSRSARKAAPEGSRQCRPIEIRPRRPCRRRVTIVDWRRP